jgi:hypothetical protein
MHFANSKLIDSPMHILQNHLWYIKTFSNRRVLRQFALLYLILVFSHLCFSQHFECYRHFLVALAYTLSVLSRNLFVGNICFGFLSVTSDFMFGCL